VVQTAGTGSSLALIGALVGIAIAGAWNRFSRRRSSADS
jgi:predicted membrane protein